MSAPSNRYEGRFRWWYEAIADRMIAHPDWHLQDIANDLGKHKNTIYYITSSDTFKTYLAKRRAEYKEKLDTRILSRTADIAALGLDLVYETMSKKRDTIPMQQLMETTGDALDRLGFGAKTTPLVQVNNTNNDNRQVVIPAITQHELLEATEALRKAERVRVLEHEALPKLESQSIDAEVLDDLTLPAERE
jgi:hypothetical protein